MWLTRPAVFWTAAHILHVEQPLIYAGSGSGDKTFDWILTFCVLAIAALAAVLWSILDRRRENYTALHKWFRVFMRFALASQMLTYGFVKAVPLQMPFPNLAKLVEPFGNFSPMGVLWNSVGASPAYETFTGCAELLGGLLLVLPRTTMFGALVCLADATQVFALNVTYDVPVKLLSFRLILLSLFCSRLMLRISRDSSSSIALSRPQRCPPFFNAPSQSHRPGGANWIRAMADGNRYAERLDSMPFLRRGDQAADLWDLGCGTNVGG